jgi:hypothetical protein
MGIHSEAELNRKFMEFARLLNIYLNHFPKHEKYAYKFRKAVKHCRQEAINSLLGHAKATNSLKYMLNLIKEECGNGKDIQIPESYRRIYNLQVCGAGLQPA